jgi:hypothetical protein
MHVFLLLLHSSFGRNHTMGRVCMKKCLKIVLSGSFSHDFLRETLVLFVRKFDVEGSAKMTDPHQIVVLVCGNKDIIDQFLDKLHLAHHTWNLDSIVIEPFLKDKDYRGIFRIIE